MSGNTLRGLPPIDDEYRGPAWWDMTELLALGQRPGLRRLLLVGLVLNVLAVLTGLLNAGLDWNGVQVQVGPFVLDLTIWPPFVLSLLGALWLGPTWGFVPAYAGNLASALLSGMDWPRALLFALAGAMEMLIFWGSMVTLNISPDLRRWRDVRRFLAVSLIAPVTGSLAVVFWNTALGLGFLEGQRIWRGWVIGDFLQSVLVVAPLLRFVGPRARAWIDRQFATPPRYEMSYTRTAALALATVALIALLVFTGLGMLRASLEIDPGALTVRGERLGDRLNEIQLFLVLLVVTLTATTGLFATALARMGERQRSLSRRESLTGCFNRRAFAELFPREADRARRLGQGLSVVFLDIDHFKPVNDRYGHETGDRLLQQLAVRIQAQIRETDLLFRWGGEEFLILLAHTSPDDAPALAERVRAAVGARPFLGDEPNPPVRVTVSLGTAGTSFYPVSAEELVSRADAACYRAKEEGRDRVSVAA
jgi:diguanylate cyclase (GGDEF)-like protein